MGVSMWQNRYSTVGFPRCLYATLQQLLRLAAPVPPKALLLLSLAIPEVKGHLHSLQQGVDFIGGQ